MNILDFEYSTKYGFAWIIVDGENKGDRWTVQCCLVQENSVFVTKINRGNCGHNEGLCADANAKAFEYWGENRCMTALFNKAKINGLIGEEFDCNVLVDTSILEGWFDG
jgi:hypothetical protein